MIKAIIFMALITFAAVLAGAAVRYLMREKSKAARNVIIAVIVISGFMGINFVGGYILAPSLFLKDCPNEEAHAYLTSHKIADAVSVNGKNGKLFGWAFFCGCADGKNDTDNDTDNGNAGAASPKSLIIYYGGNKECSALRMKYLAENEIYSEIFDGFYFVCVDYPGYCDSEGTAGSKTFKQYGLDVYDYLTASDSFDRVYIMGYSIGTGVANYVASYRECDGLILLAPYSDGSDLYNTVADIFHGPLKILVGFDMKSSEYAGNIKLRPLILAAGSDEVIPCGCAKRLSECYPDGADFVLIDGIGHSDIWGNPTALQKIREYLEQYLKKV